MKTINKKRIKLFLTKLKSDRTAEKARGNNKTAYTRKRKFPLCDILESILNKQGLTTSMDIRNFFKKKAESKAISVQGYLKQRKKLNPEVFVDLNDYYLSLFYEATEEIKTWNGYIVLAVDGSKVEITNSLENRVKYGTIGNNYTEGSARAMVSGLFDVMNDFFLDLQICNVNDSEAEAAKRNLEALKRIGINQKVLVIFDRGYPSLDLLNYLSEIGVSYIIRLSSRCYMNERKSAEKDDSWVEIMHTSSRLGNMKRKDVERFHHLKTVGNVRTRFIRSRTPSGTEFALFTNLPDEISGTEICKAYFKRWKIEEAYDTLKNKMKFESLTGKASIYVEQDFLSQVLVYNLMEDMRHSAEEALIEKKKYLKYPVRINQNTAIGIFKDEFLRIMIEADIEKRNSMIENVIEEMQKYYLPLRESQSKERNFHHANKYASNQKSPF